jgi:heterodisulfide reductase subunit B
LEFDSEKCIKQSAELEALMANQETATLNPELAENNAGTLARTVEAETGSNVSLCYQCAKCSSGCPVVAHMDRMPNQVMRAVQFDDRSVLNSKTIWLCASCQTCTTRCPQGMDIAGVMDTLRIEAKQQGIAPAVPTVELFNRLFLRNAGWFGRVYELGLMGSMNMMTGKPFNDMAMGIEMLKRGKLRLLPSVTRPPRKVEPVKSEAGTIAYYPGCSLHSTAKEYDDSIRAVAGELGLKLVEPPGWVCCGSTPAHSSDHKLATLMPVQNLATIEQMGLEKVTAPCSACYARLKTAAHTMATSEDRAQEVNAELGYQYQGKVEVQNLLETLAEHAGPEKLAARTRKPLAGLKVASYYGCLLTRPPQVTQSEHPENPMQMEAMVEALGAEPVSWSYKTDCCGGTLGLTQTPLALEMTGKILQNARDCGADMVVTACPMCHVNLDARQSQIHLDFSLPVLYLTQLMGLAFGCGEDQVRLKKNFVNPEPALAKLG